MALLSEGSLQSTAGTSRRDMHAPHLQLALALVAASALCGCARTEPLFCGQPDDLPCPEGMLCDEDGRCRPDPGTCPEPGQVRCSATLCADVDSDPLHCGDCATACGARQVCLRGQCRSTCGDLADCLGTCRN